MPIGSIADLTFVVPDVCNAGGYDLDFERTVVSGPRIDGAATRFEWEIPAAHIIDNEPFCGVEVPVRVIFPVLYNTGPYTIRLDVSYQPTPLTIPKTTSFESPAFTIVEGEL